MSYITTRARFVAALAALALMIALPGIVSAHSDLVSSVPAAGSTVASAPERVVATFDNHDPLSASESLLTVTDASGAQVDMGDTTLDKSDADRKTLTVSLRTGLGNGVYTVNWKAVSDGGDGSVTEGSFTFTAGSGAAAAAPAQLPRTGADGGAPWIALPAALALIALGRTIARRNG
jgi:copper transport protein